MTADAPSALDRAWAAAEAPGAGDAEMARYYECFAAAELFMPVEPDSLEGDGPPRPALFALESGDTALVFDREARLAAFMGGDGGDGGGAAHLTLSGRAAIAMFAGRGVGLAVNLGEAPSATVLPADAVDWAAAALSQPIEAEEGREILLRAPRGAAPDLLTRLDARLSAMGGEVKEAWLCGLGGREGGLVLCVALRVAEAERGVVGALAETARFAGGDAPAFDIAVMAASDPRLAAARKAGLGFEPGAPESARPGPGGDPAQPPKLR